MDEFPEKHRAAIKKYRDTWQGMLDFFRERDEHHRSGNMIEAEFRVFSDWRPLLADEIWTPINLQIFEIWTLQSPNPFCVAYRMGRNYKSPPKHELELPAVGDVDTMLKAVEVMREIGRSGGLKSGQARRKTAVDPKKVREAAHTLGWPAITDGVLKRLGFKFHVTPERIGQILKGK